MSSPNVVIPFAQAVSKKNMALAKGREAARHRLEATYRRLDEEIRAHQEGMMRLVVEWAHVRERLYPDTSFDDTVFDRVKRRVKDKLGLLYIDEKLFRRIFDAVDMGT